MAAPAGSRRDSRIHLQLRHSDALQEHEAFRRKYLLVNKHITKLNAGLNLRVEELNVTITQLTAENLALRSRVIELTRRLSTEQASTRRAAAEAETLTANTIRHLTSLRDTFAALSSPSISQTAPQQPSATPRQATTRTALAKKPDVSFIREASVEHEEAESPASAIPSSEGPLEEESPSPSPPPAAAFITSRRPARRPSDAASAVPAPPLRPSQAVATATTAASAGAPMSSTYPSPSANRSVSSEDEVEHELDTPPSMTARTAADNRGKPRSRVAAERQRSPGTDDRIPIVGVSVVSKKSARKEIELDALKEESGEELFRPGPSRKPSKRRPLTPPPATTLSSSSTHVHLRYVDPSPAPEEMNGEVDEQAIDGSRERRARKSVNYAEPKLNTKMRKPENYDSSRSTAAHRPPVTTPRVTPSSATRTSASGSTKKKQHPEFQADESDGQERTDEESSSVRKASKVRRHTMGM